MKTVSQIGSALQKQSECLLMASDIYKKSFSNTISEEAYYQTLTRMCKQKELIRLSKGIYCIPQKTRFGMVTPSEKEIINYFVDNEHGVVLGYSLYNSIGLTTQVSKTVHILSSRIADKKRNLNNIYVEKLNMVFTAKRKSVICMLDILYNFKNIEDLNYKAFLTYCKQFASEYNEFETEYVIEKTGYPKWTIAFLAEVLNFFKVNHSLNQYLSPLSKYNIPNMEDIYESAH